MDPEAMFCSPFGTNLKIMVLKFLIHREIFILETERFKVNLIKLIFILSVFVYPNLGLSQIVNMESSRKENLLGSHLQLNLGLNGSSGTVDRTNYSLEGRVDINSSEWQRFAIFSYKREEKDNSITSNNTFMHLRGVRKISSLLAVEGFIQLSEKPLQKIKRRFYIA